MVDHSENSTLEKYHAFARNQHRSSCDGISRPTGGVRPRSEVHCHVILLGFAGLVLGPVAFSSQMRNLYLITWNFEAFLE